MRELATLVGNGDNIKVEDGGQAKILEVYDKDEDKSIWASIVSFNEGLVHKEFDSIKGKSIVVKIYVEE